MKDKKPLSSLKYFIAVCNPFSKTIIAKEDLNDLRFRAYKRDVIGRVIFKTGHYDKFLSAYLTERFKNNGGIFLDVGANLGYYACLFGKISGSGGRVMAFEPEPDNIDLLRRNLKINNLSNVSIFPVALGDQDGEAILNVYKASNRGRHSIGNNIGSRHQVRVAVKRLDDLVQAHLNPHDRISCLKMDVEGYEPLVMLGGKKTLERVDLFITEYAPYLLNYSSNQIDRFLQTLVENFRKIYEIKEDGLMDITIDEIKSRTGVLDLLCEK